MRAEERKNETERAELEWTTMEKEIQKIQAQREKVKAEIAQQTITMVNTIKAETDVKYNEILAEAQLIQTEILANARAEAARIKAEADAYSQTKLADIEKENAQTIA